MTCESTKVGMAEFEAVKDPGVLVTLGLGSCVGVCLYDRTSKVIGLAHIMLPTSKGIKNNGNMGKFADTAIQLLREKMVVLGASKSRIEAKIAGGAQMFSFKNSSDLMKIGERNVEAVKAELNRLSIGIVAEDVGGSYGRTIELRSSDGQLSVRTIGHGTKVI